MFAEGSSLKVHCYFIPLTSVLILLIPSASKNEIFLEIFGNSRKLRSFKKNQREKSQVKLLFVFRNLFGADLKDFQVSKNSFLSHPLS